MKLANFCVWDGIIFYGRENFCVGDGIIFYGRKSLRVADKIFFFWKLSNSIFGHEIGVDYRYQWQLTELRNVEQKILGARLKFCGLKIKFYLANSSLTLRTCNLRKLLDFFLLLDSFFKILLSDIGVVCLRTLNSSKNV